MSSPAHHSPPPSNNGGLTPTTKTKEKKRVGFSAGDGTPLKEHQEYQWESSQAESSSTAARPQHLLPGNHSVEHHEHDGVDHNELTRALSRILQEDDLPGSAARRAPPPSQPSHIQPPQPPGLAYLPTERQQQSERAAKERADRLAQSVERANSTPVSRATSIDGDSEAEEEAAQAAISALYNRTRRRPSNAAYYRGSADIDPEHRAGHSTDLDQAQSTALQIVRAHSLSRLHNFSQLNSSNNTVNDFHYDAALSAAAGRSGTSTPTALYERDGREYVPRPPKYHGGILSSLLRLYSNGNNHNTSQPGSGYNSGQSTPGGSATPTSSLPPSPSTLEVPSVYTTNTSSGTSTPRRIAELLKGKSGKQAQSSNQPWKQHRHANSTTSLSAGLIGSSSMLVSAGSADIGQAVTERVKRERPPLKRSRHSGSLFSVKGVKPRKDKESGKRRREEEIRITVHIAHVLSRHRYLTKLCRALMMYGAPTHRLEDYLKMSSRVLEIEAQFLYIPGCMLVSFDDSSTHTAEVKLVRAPQGVDLGKLHDVHGIYKEVVHDLISVDEALLRLDNVNSKKVKFKRWFTIPVYGMASVCVAPFAFQGRFIDLPIAFVLGCIVGTLQLVAAPSSAMYSNVFEISAAVITSFLARAAGSISDGKLFCFSALAQSSIALILPGYMVLCASLELQSQNIVAGSVRMVYAMIYSLFLGYGITIGSAIYGAIDSGATSSTTCTNPLSRPWYFLFVPAFTICLCIINQAKWKQIPMMVMVSTAGFAVNSYASVYFSSNAQIPNTLGALTVGVFANLNSRLGRYFERFFLITWAKYLQPHMKKFNVVKRFRQWRSSRQAAKRPLDPREDYFDLPTFRKDSGVSNDGTPIQTPGQMPADAIASEAAAADAANAAAERKAPGQAEVMGYGLAAAAMLPAIFVQVPSGLAVNGSLLAGIESADNLTGSSSSSSNSVAFAVLYSVIQVAIGITVGLFLSAMIVYPLGKRRSALFSF